MAFWELVVFIRVVWARSIRARVAQSDHLLCDDFTGVWAHIAHDHAGIADGHGAMVRWVSGLID